MRLLGVHHQTSLGMPAMTVETVSARNVEGQNHPVAFLDALYRLANFFDYPHNLVSHHGPFFQRGTAVIHM